MLFRSGRHVPAHLHRLLGQRRQPRPRPPDGLHRHRPPALPAARRPPLRRGDDPARRRGVPAPDRLAPPRAHRGHRTRRRLTPRSPRCPISKRPAPAWPPPCRCSAPPSTPCTRCRPPVTSTRRCGSAPTRPSQTGARDVLIGLRRYGHLLCGQERQLAVLPYRRLPPDEPELVAVTASR